MQTDYFILQLELAANDLNSAAVFSSNLDLVLACLRSVASDELVIAVKASRVLICLTKQGDAGNVLIQAAVVEEMRKLCLKNDTVRYRIYDILISLGCTSDEKLASIHNAKLIQPLIEEALNNDILVQLNALELLRNLSAPLHGRVYLEQEKIVDKLIDALSASVGDPLASLIVPGLLKFFGTFAHFQPEMLVKYPLFTEILFNLMNDDNMGIVIVAMETISFIATTAEGKTRLRNEGETNGIFVLFFSCPTYVNL